MLPTLKVHPAFSALADLAGDVLLQSSALSQRYGYSDDHLSNLRKRGRGWPFIRLPTGAIRYRLSDVLASELQGQAGPLSLERVKLAVLATPGVPKATLAAIVAHLEDVLTLEPPS